MQCSKASGRSRRGEEIVVTDISPKTYVAVEVIKMPPCGRTPAPHCFVELVLDDPRYTRCLECGRWAPYTGNEWREDANLS